MSDDVFLKNWVLLQTGTATDQFIGINQSNGQAWSFRSDNPKAERWFHWLIVQAPGGNRHWLFNRLAQGGSGECLALPKGTNVFGQWRFLGEKRQTFELRQRAGGSVTLICEENHEALSTRWDRPTFTWGYTPGDDQQKLRIVAAEPLDLPALPEIEGEPGALDRNLLKVKSFKREVAANTPWRVVGAELIAFPRIDDGWPIGDRMNYSPYYLLTRDSSWTLSFDEEYSGGGEDVKTFEWEQGTTTTSETSLEETLNIQVGVDASYKPVEGAGLGGGFSVSYRHGRTWRRTDSVERYKGQKGTSSRRFKEGKRVRVACWHLVNRYTLTRRTGDIVGQIECIEPAVAVERAYPPEDAPAPVPSSSPRGQPFRQTELTSR
jgi:hypothetical protein